MAHIIAGLLQRGPYGDASAHRATSLV